MPSYRKAFPSKFLKADDIAVSQDVEIKRVAFETVGAGQRQERKLVVHFVELEKGLVLNLINADTIAEITGSDDYESWGGHRITLFPTKTEFQGKRVPCLRITEPSRQTSRRPPANTQFERVPDWVSDPEQAVRSGQAGKARDIDEAMGSPAE